MVNVFNPDARRQELLDRCAAAYLFVAEFRRTPKYTGSGDPAEQDELGREHLLYLLSQGWLAA